MGALILTNPRNVLVPFALALVEMTSDIYTSVVQLRNSPRMMKNLKWLEHLKSKIRVRLAQTPEENYSVGGGGGRNESDDTEVLGWRTRLIQRAGQGFPSVHTSLDTKIQNETNQAIRSDQSGPALEGITTDAGGVSFSESNFLNAFANISSTIENERCDHDSAVSIVSCFPPPCFHQNWGSR